MSRQITFQVKQIQAALKYIDSYWQNLVRYQPEDEHTLIGLPERYVVPSYDRTGRFSFNEQYYWDSYFISKGLMRSGQTELAKGGLENLCYMMGRFGIIPNASRSYFTGRSHPPFLTSYIMEIYSATRPGRGWLGKHIALAHQEYFQVWMGVQHPNWRRLSNGLSRYYDVNVLHDLAEAESGWDMTSRFDRRCLDFAPVDLNALLYKYETDFATAATILGNAEESQVWIRQAAKRRRLVTATCWDTTNGFYFDYDWTQDSRSAVWSLAGYYPMWAGMATAAQAAQMVKNLGHFEQAGGLSATAEQSGIVSQLPTQWAYPNGWAPLMMLVVEGLEKYGYTTEARRIARTWIDTNLEYFKKHGIFLEKYNVVEPGAAPAEGMYPSQTGFGWTNSVFVAFCQDYLTAEERGTEQDLTRAVRQGVRSVRHQG